MEILIIVILVVIGVAFFRDNFTKEGRDRTDKYRAQAFVEAEIQEKKKRETIEKKNSEILELLSQLTIIDNNLNSFIDELIVYTKLYDSKLYGGNSFNTEEIKHINSICQKCDLFLKEVEKYYLITTRFYIDSKYQEFKIELKKNIDGLSARISSLKEVKVALNSYLEYSDTSSNNIKYPTTECYPLDFPFYGDDYTLGKYNNLSDNPTPYDLDKQKSKYLHDIYSGIWLDEDGLMDGGFQSMEYESTSEKHRVINELYNKNGTLKIWVV